MPSDFLSDIGLGIADFGGGQLPFTGNTGSYDFGGGGFDFGNFANSLSSGLDTFGNFAKAALPAAQLGLAGLGVFQGIKGGQQSADQTKIAEQAAKTNQGIASQAQAIAAPAAQFGSTQLANATAGKIPEAQQAQIDLWKQAAKQQAHDYLARAGISDSSTAASWDAWIDQQAVGMAQQALIGEQGTGLQGIQTASGALNSATGASASAGNIAAGQQNSLENLIAGANQVLARLTAGAS